MSEPEGPAERPTRTRLLLYSFLASFLVILFLNFLVFRHFLIVLTVAAAVAALLGPIYDRLTAALRGRRSLAAGIMVGLTIVVLLVPFLSYAVLLGRQAVEFVEWIRPRVEPEALRKLWMETLPQRYPWLASAQQWLSGSGQEGAGLMDVVSPMLTGLASGANRVLQRTVAGLTTAVFELLLFLVALFFVLRDGKTLGVQLRALAPVSEEQAFEIYDHLTRTVKGVLYAMVVVPIVQGLLAMIGFAIFGLPSPVFWGTVLIFSAVIPGIGSPLVWVPAAGFLLATRPPWQGIGLFLYGVLIISTSDNVIKPILLRETARIHPLLAFLALLGGILSFGVIGFLLGPIILSLLLSAIRIYAAEIAPPAAAAAAEGPPAGAA